MSRVKEVSLKLDDNAECCHPAQTSAPELEPAPERTLYEMGAEISGDFDVLPKEHFEGSKD